MSQIRNRYINIHIVELYGFLNIKLSNGVVIIYVMREFYTEELEYVLEIVNLWELVVLRDVQRFIINMSHQYWIRFILWASVICGYTSPVLCRYTSKHVVSIILTKPNWIIWELSEILWELFSLNRLVIWSCSSCGDTRHLLLGFLFEHPHILMTDNVSTFFSGNPSVEKFHNNFISCEDIRILIFSFDQRISYADIIQWFNLDKESILHQIIVCKVWIIKIQLTHFITMFRFEYTNELRSQCKDLISGFALSFHPFQMTMHSNHHVCHHRLIWNESRYSVWKSQSIWYDIDWFNDLFSVFVDVSGMWHKMTWYYLAYNRLVTMSTNYLLSIGSNHPLYNGKLYHCIDNLLLGSPLSFFRKISLSTCEHIQQSYIILFRICS